MPLLYNRRKTYWFIHSSIVIGVSCEPANRIETVTAIFLPGFAGFVKRVPRLPFRTPNWLQRSVLAWTALSLETHLVGLGFVLAELHHGSTRFIGVKYIVHPWKVMEPPCL